VLRRSIGAAVESANQWRRLNMCIQNVVKGMELFGVLYFRFYIQRRMIFFLFSGQKTNRVFKLKLEHFGFENENHPQMV
jgi:hypothetical protein